MPFLALDLSLDLIRGLRPTIELLRRKSPRLRRQLEDSLAGIVQNVCEGSGRAGGDRPQLYRIGLGSLREVNGILLAARHSLAPDHTPAPMNHRGRWLSAHIPTLDLHVLGVHVPDDTNMTAKAAHWQAIQ